MNIDERLEILQKQVSQQAGHKVDLYYFQGYGALAVPNNYPLHPKFVIFAFPEVAINY